MATHVLSGLAVDAPVAQEAVGALAYKHGFLTKPFTGNSQITTFDSGAQDWSNLIVGAFPLERTRETNEITLLNGAKISSDSPVTVPSQTVKVLVRLGSNAYSIIRDYDYTLPNSPYAGQWMGFARPYPDGNVLLGRTKIENHTPEGDPDADLFGYNVTWAFEGVTFWDGRANLNPPTYTASGSTTTGAAGAEQTVNGTNLLNVDRVQYRTAGGVLVSTVQATSFGTRTATQIKLTPTGLASATAYSRILVYQGGEVSAGTFTSS